VRVLCLQEMGTLAGRLEALGVPVESLDCPGLPKVRTLFRLTRRLSTLRPDVLHTHNPTPHLFGSLAGRLLGVPAIVHTKHGRNYPDRFRAVSVNRLASALTHTIVPVSDDAACVARQAEGVAPRKLTVIRNGIDLEKFPLPAPRGAATGKHAIHVARLNPVKDQKTLLQAIRFVVRVEPNFRLDLVGDGPAATELLALRDELSLGDCVHFLGYRQDVSSLLAGADLFLLSSLKEGISLTLLEAMATGLPIVATDVGGNREVVAHGETGLLVPPRSPEALAGAILSLIQDPNRARAMGTAGRRRVEDHFDLRQVVATYEELYRSCLTRLGTRGRRISSVNLPCLRGVVPL
jgi:glycosyltransferase involved in cell wall biosynthesis